MVSTDYRIVWLSKSLQLVSKKGGNIFTDSKDAYGAVHGKLDERCCIAEEKT